MADKKQLQENLKTQLKKFPEEKVEEFIISIGFACELHQQCLSGGTSPGDAARNRNVSGSKKIGRLWY
jgi:hypothetical protein